MAQQSAAQRKYPFTVNLAGTTVTLRLMQAADEAALLKFAQSLPEDDLLFLSVDITKPEAVAQWAMGLETGHMHTILAEVEGELVGHGSLLHNYLQWTRHLGEMMLLISPKMRGKGLGHLLASELFALAKSMNLRKIAARMAFEQKGAIQVFERLGFKPEALLADYVIDRRDCTHDLIVMSYDVTGLTEE
jgi:RimJ/RimL family protein N-acetyltransferase